MAGRRVFCPAWMSLPAAVMLVGYTNWLYHARALEFWSVKGILLVDCAVFLFVLAHARLEEFPSPAPLLWRGLAFGGVLSYGIYGWHA